MASLSPKASDAKKTVATKTILSPTNRDTTKSSLLKSPPSKLASKIPSSPGLKVDSSKLGSKIKSEIGIPKVNRSPSAKSLSPPTKAGLKSPVSASIKPVWDKRNSQGDIGLSPGLKNAITGLHVENGDVIHKLDNNDIGVNLNEKSADPQTEEYSTKDYSETILNGNTTLDNFSTPPETPIKMTEQNPVDKIEAAISEQKHASGDSISSTSPVNETVDVKGSSGESVTPTEVKVGDGSSEEVQCPRATESDEHKEPQPEPPVTQESLTEQLEKLDIEGGDEKKEETVHDTSAVSSTPTDCTQCTVELGAVSAESPEELKNKPLEITKQTFREKVWKNLEGQDLVTFPRPCNDRIPNFLNAPAAAGKLSQMEFFKKAKTVKVNPDKPQEFVRFHTLEYGKRLLVPSPRLREGLFLAVTPPSEANKFQLQQVSQRLGMKKWGKPINLDEKVTIDLVVLGSVAVDRKGHRIGKGEGFADLEFAMLMKMNAVNENTIIVTTVHDEQLFDELPDEIFREYDVPVDWIITPTQVIEVAEKLPRPKGIIWNILSNRRILEIPILQKLREQEISEGQECTLKEVDSDVEDKPNTVKSLFNKRFTKRRNYYYFSTGDPIRDSKLPAPSPYYNNRQRRFSPNQQNRNLSSAQRYDAPQLPPPPPMQQQQRQYYQGPYVPKQPLRQQQPQHHQSRNMNHQPRYPMGPPMNSNYTPRNMNRGPRNMNYHQDGMYPQYRMNNRGRNMNRPQNNSSMNKSVQVQTSDNQSRPSRQYIKRKRTPIEFSLRVKNIGTGVRVRDLKTALNERGIKPRDITWRGYRGFAFLHFVKTAAKEDKKPLTVEDVIGALQGLPLPPKNKKTLVIEPAKPKMNAAGEEETSSADEEKKTSTTSADDKAITMSSEQGNLHTAVTIDTQTPTTIAV